MSELARLQEEVRARGGDVPAMLPAAAYTSEEVLAWEQRHLYAGSWTCLGRLEELLPDDPRAGPPPSGRSGSATSRRC
jgi:Rieske 2Fe-2S family protein